MKRTFFLSIIAGVFALFTLSQTADAQFRFGGGLSYGNWLNTPGISPRLEMKVFDEFWLVPMLDINVPKFRAGTFLNSASLHLHYNIQALSKVWVYPLAGVSIKSYLDIDRVGNDPAYFDFAFSPCGGAGAKADITSTFAIFVETRLEILAYPQLVGTAGVLIRPRRYH